MSEQAINFEAINDVELAHHAGLRNADAVRVITTRNNQRLFRVAWGVLRDHDEAEDVLQEAYLKAFTSIQTYAGEASLATWLTRIVLNTAIDRKRSVDRRRADLLSQDIAMLDEYRAQYAQNEDKSPENELLRAEAARLIQSALSRLEEEFRLVFVLRDIEGLSVRETAQMLEIKEATVKTRLFRARRELRNILEPGVKSVFTETLPFAGADCVAMTRNVLVKLNLQTPQPGE